MPGLLMKNTESPQDWSAAHIRTMARYAESIIRTWDVGKLSGKMTTISLSFARDAARVEILITDFMMENTTATSNVRYTGAWTRQKHYLN